MSAELPRPDDPELESLWEREIYERHYANAQLTIQEHPFMAARIIAEFWMQATLLDLLRGSLR